MNKDFKLICNVQEQIIFGPVMRVHDLISEQMILLSQSFKLIIYVVQQNQCELFTLNWLDLGYVSQKHH